MRKLVGLVSGQGKTPEQLAGEMIAAVEKFKKAEGQERTPSGGSQPEDAPRPHGQRADDDTT